MQFEIRTGTGLWTVATFILSASLWAQLFWYPLSIELQTASPSNLYLAAYLAPLFAATLGLVVRAAGVGLFGVPLSLLPGLVLLPERDLAALSEPKSALFIGGTLLVYVVCAVFASKGRSSSEFQTDESATARRRVDGTYPGFIAVRVAVLVLLFAAIAWAVFFDPGIAERFETVHAEAADSARTFAAIFGFFAWCVAAYTLFFRPLANLEYQARGLSRRIDALGEDRSRLRLRLVGWSVVAVVGVGLWMAFGTF